MAHATLYGLSVPPLIRGLENLSAILDFASTYETTPKFLTARLCPDMRNFTYQVYRTTDYCLTLLCSRLLSLPTIPQLTEPEESTFDGLKERIDATITFLKTVQPKDFAGKDNKIITLRPPEGWNANAKESKKQVQHEVKYHGAADYLGNFVVPSFWFHLCVAYAILRAQGLPIGKFEFLNAGGRMDIMVVED